MENTKKYFFHKSPLGAPYMSKLLGRKLGGAQEWMKKEVECCLLLPTSRIEENYYRSFVLYVKNLQIKVECKIQSQATGDNGAYRTIGVGWQYEEEAPSIIVAQEIKTYSNRSLDPAP